MNVNVSKIWAFLGYGLWMFFLVSSVFYKEPGIAHLGTPIVFLLVAIYLELSRKGDV